MENATTKQLHEELVNREGIREIIITPHETFELKTAQQVVELTGPARILINQD